MCLAMPMEIIEVVDENTALVWGGGQKITINTYLIDGPQIGDYVIVHAGFALEYIDSEEAEERNKLFNELAAISENADNTVKRE
jgi:hydrogenase expression/formation protein HypC